MKGRNYIATKTADRTETTYDKEAYVQQMQERRKDLADKLENGLKELYSSDKYADYLKTISKFPRYSSRNTLLIHMQMPGASRVAAAGKWKSDFKRHPKKGEKAIYIYAPTKNDKEPEKKLMEKLDPETGAPMLDKDGKIIMEEMMALDISRMRYKPVPVFDVSQTDGKALPEIVSPLNGDVERFEALLDALKAVSPLPLEFEKMSEAQDGYCRYGEKIGIREGMSERQTVAAIVHEIAHARLHDKADIPEGEAKKPRAVKELEAESVAFAICDKYGVDSGANSFGYLATWAGHDPETKQLKASLDTIQKEVGSLSRELDAHYAAALKNRGLDKDGSAVLPQDTISTPEVNPRNLPGYSDEGVFIRQFAVLNNRVKEVSAELKANDVEFTFTEGYTDSLTFFVIPNEADAAKCGVALNKLNVENLFGVSEEFLRKREPHAEQPQERKSETKVANTKGLDAICAKARKYIKENGLFLAFSVNDIKDYQSLRRAAQDVEARNSAHPTAGRNHINFMYDLLRQAEPFQNEQPLAEPPLKQEPRDSLLWSQGEITCPVSGEKYKYWVKHFDTGSHYGIDGGCISKLTIRKLGEYKDLCNFDRGWDVRPTREVKEVYAILLQTYNLPKEKEIAAAEEAAIHAGEREKALHDIDEEQLEPPAPFDMGPKEYSLGFGYTGSVNSPDGIEVWNWADEKPEGGYTVVANISTEREVTFVEENMPDSVKDEIFDKANTAIMQEEEQSECRFVPAANLPDGWRWQQWDDGSGSLQSPDDESVVSYDLSTSEYKYKGEWNFMAGYPSETESFSSFKDSMEKRVCIDRGIDEAALPAEQPQTAQEKTVAPADYLPEWYDNPPDNRITVAEQIEYGYSDYDNMLPLTQQRAIDLFERGVPIYLLYQDGTESAADDVGHIKGHDGIFGVESEDWVNSAVFKEEKAKSADKKAPEPEALATEPTMSTFPLYKGNLSDAVDCGETEIYHQSRQLNFLCRDTIDRTIEEHRKSIPDAPAGVCTYDMKAAVWSVISECGRDRAEWVLASNINGASSDGRFSRENKEWAKNTGAPERHDYHIQTHKAVLDGFARRFRESEKEKPPMSFLYAQAQQRKNSAEAQKSGGDIEQSGHKKSEER